MEHGHTHVPAECKRVAAVLSRVGDKWTILVVKLLGDGPLRFNEIRKRIDGISQRMLTLTLRALERDGFVTRTVFPISPPRVDYELTPLGRSLLEPVQRLGDWAIENMDGIEAAQRRFDAATEAETAATPRPRRAAGM